MAEGQNNFEKVVLLNQEPRQSELCRCFIVPFWSSKLVWPRSFIINTGPKMVLTFDDGTTILTID
jgi:hypothetical protein